jgi:acyl carrier protein
MIDGKNKFRELETWDSLTEMAELFMIEKNYGVTIPPDDFVKLQTPEEIFEYVQARIKS